MHVLTYVASASVSDCLQKDGCCFQCLASTLIMMTTIPQLRTGSRVKEFLQTTTGPTYACEDRNNRERMPKTANTCTHPLKERNNRILRRNASHPTSVKNEHSKSTRPRLRTRPTGTRYPRDQRGSDNKGCYWQQ